RSARGYRRPDGPSPRFSPLAPLLMLSQPRYTANLRQWCGGARVRMQYFPGKLERKAQMALLAEIRAIIVEAPLFTPAMPRSGKEMSVRRPNCGPLGGVPEKERGYRYQPMHPVTGRPWPPMPQMLLDLWQEVADYPIPPEACLVNYYAGNANMGLHQDKDE